MVFACETADDEVVAELCEQMLRDEEKLRAFAARETKAAVTIREHLNLLLAKIKTLLQGKRSFSESSELVKAQETVNRWYESLSTAIQNAENRAVQTSETAQDDGVRMMIETVGKYTFVKADKKLTEKVLKGDNPREWGRQTTNHINNVIRNGKDILVHAADGDDLLITHDTAGKASFRNYVKDVVTGKKRLMTAEEYRVKLEAELHIDEIARISRRNATGGLRSDSKDHNFARDGFFHYRTAYYRNEKGYYRLSISVGEDGAVGIVYNIGKLDPTALPTAIQKKETALPTKVAQRPVSSKAETVNAVSNDTISTPAEKSNTPAENSQFGEVRSKLDADGIAAVSQQIADVMDEGEYAYYGIRVENRVQYQVGDRVNESRVWVDGNESDDMLDGSSCIGVRTEDNREIEKAVKAAGLYFGDDVYLIAGNSMQYGEDAGEYVIRDAKVAAVLKQGAGETGIRFMLDDQFIPKYDAWDKVSRKRFFIGTTSSIMSAFSNGEKKIYWNSNKILEIKKKHPKMTDPVIKQVPEILENPVIALDSRTVQGRVVLFGEVFDKGGNPVLAAVELEPSGKDGEIRDFVVIASAYARGENIRPEYRTEALQEFINTSNIRYVDPNKKRTQAWLKRTRLQLPIGVKLGFNGTVPYSMQNVKENALDSVRFKLDINENDVRDIFSGMSADDIVIVDADMTYGEVNDAFSAGVGEKGGGDAFPIRMAGGPLSVHNFVAIPPLTCRDADTIMGATVSTQNS